MADDVECYILGDVEAFFASFERGDYAEQWNLACLEARMALAKGALEAPPGRVPHGID